MGVPPPKEKVCQLRLPVSEDPVLRVGQEGQGLPRGLCFRRRAPGECAKARRGGGTGGGLHNLRRDAAAWWWRRHASHGQAAQEDSRPLPALRQALVPPPKEKVSARGICPVLTMGCG